MRHRTRARHRRDWRRFWRYCRCGYRWRCPDSVDRVPMPYEPTVPPLDRATFRASVRSARNEIASVLSGRNETASVLSGRNETASVLSGRNETASVRSAPNGVVTARESVGRGVPEPARARTRLGNNRRTVWDRPSRPALPDGRAGSLPPAQPGRSSRAARTGGAPR